MATNTCEIVWLVGLLHDVVVHIRGPTTLFCDKAPMQIAANPIYHERTRHIKIDCHLVREKINLVTFSRRVWGKLNMITWSS